jgi:hypothetical protein
MPTSAGVGAKAIHSSVLSIGVESGCCRCDRATAAWGRRLPLAVPKNERLLVALGHSNAAVPLSAKPSQTKPSRSVRRMSALGGKQTYVEALPANHVRARRWSSPVSSQPWPACSRCAVTKAPDRRNCSARCGVSDGFRRSSIAPPSSRTG